MLFTASQTEMLKCALYNTTLLWSTAHCAAETGGTGLPPVTGWQKALNNLLKHWSLPPLPNHTLWNHSGFARSPKSRVVLCWEYQLCCRNSLETTPPSCIHPCSKNNPSVSTRNSGASAFWLAASVAVLFTERLSCLPASPVIEHLL